MAKKKAAVSGKETARRAAQAKKIPKALKTLTAEQRAALDPLVHQVKGMQRQAYAAGLQLDTMMSLVFPKWAEGQVEYNPETGEIRPKGEAEQISGPAEVHAPLEKLN